MGPGTTIGRPSCGGVARLDTAGPLPVPFVAHRARHCTIRNPTRGAGMPVTRRRLLTAVSAVTAATAVQGPAQAADGTTAAHSGGDASAARPAGASAELRHWPPAQARRLERLIRESAGRPGAYAVFDADNTIWRNDLEEALLPYLEMLGELTPRSLDPSLRLIPFREAESLYSYYVRLCE